MSVSTVVEDAGQNQSVFPYDYCYLYKNATTKSKYFIPLLATKLFLTALVNVALESQPFPMMAFNTIISIIFFLYLLLVRPFQSAFTNFRLVFLELLVCLVNAAFCVYQYFAAKSEYITWLEHTVLIGIIVIMSVAILFALVEHYRSWIHKVWNLCDGCCLYFRLLGRSKKVFTAEESERKEISVKPIEEGDVV